eukprot:s3515_g3.t1
MLFMPTAALQQTSYPLARLLVHSSAASADREIGSGDFGCHVPALGHFDSSGALCPSFSFWSHEPPGLGTIRYGEARHPGPPLGNTLTVGVSNPGGLRQKEEFLLGLGPGIWSVAETQLSATTFKTCSGILRRQAQSLNRAVRFHGGAPAPLRHGSQWAGRWTGVAVLSDIPAATLDVPWPLEHWNSGRVLLTKHWIHNFPITIGTFYGFAQGPTWPKARQLSDQLLEIFYH